MLSVTRYCHPQPLIIDGTITSRLQLGFSSLFLHPPCSPLEVDKHKWAQECAEGEPNQRKVVIENYLTSVWPIKSLMPGSYFSYNHLLMLGLLLFLKELPCGSECVPSPHGVVCFSAVVFVSPVGAGQSQNLFMHYWDLMLSSYYSAQSLQSAYAQHTTQHFQTVRSTDTEF